MSVVLWDVTHKIGQPTILLEGDMDSKKTVIARFLRYMEQAPLGQAPQTYWNELNGVLSELIASGLCSEDMMKRSLEVLLANTKSYNKLQFHVSAKVYFNVCAGSALCGTIEGQRRLKFALVAIASSSEEIFEITGCAGALGEALIMVSQEDICAFETIWSDFINVSSQTEHLNLSAYLELLLILSGCSRLRQFVIRSVINVFTAVSRDIVTRQGTYLQAGILLTLAEDQTKGLNILIRLNEIYSVAILQHEQTFSEVASEVF